MKLLHLMDRTIIVTRLQPVSGTANRLALSTVTAIQGHVQPVGADKTQGFSGVYGKTYRIWIDPAKDVQEGDLLRGDDGNHYKVRKAGVTRHQYGGIDFKEIIVEIVSK